jgi:hypothetical protein
MVKEVNNQNKSQKENYWWNNGVLYCKSVESILSTHPKNLYVCCCNLSNIAQESYLLPRFVHQSEYLG